MTSLYWDSPKLSWHVPRVVMSLSISGWEQIRISIELKSRWKIVGEMDQRPLSAETPHSTYSWCSIPMIRLAFPFQWRHIERNGVWNHLHLDCLLNCLFRCTSKNTGTPKHHVTGLCEENHRRPVDSLHKRPVTRKMLPFDDVIMLLFQPSFHAPSWSTPMPHDRLYNVVNLAVGAAMLRCETLHTALPHSQDRQVFFCDSLSALQISGKKDLIVPRIRIWFILYEERNGRFSML